jgi:hypothetical protein
MEPKLKRPGTKPLKLKCDTLLSTSAFKHNLRRYNKQAVSTSDAFLGMTHNKDPGAAGRTSLVTSQPAIQ